VKNPIKIVKIIVITAVIVVLSFGAIAMINQYSQLNSEISKLPSFESPQIQKEPAKEKVESKIEPIKTQPVQPELVQPETVQPETVQPETVQLEPVQPEPVQPEPVQPEPVQTEPVIVCSGNEKCFTGIVTKIVDGDTLDINGIRIRISLTNTPERNETGFLEATEFTEKLCQVNSLASVDQDDLQPYDEHGRMLGKVTCSGKVLNSELLYHQLANISIKYCSTSEFSSESWAQENGCKENQVTPQQIPKETPNDSNDCDSSYPDFCIPHSPPDLDCKDVLPHKKFTVKQPDPHHFDGNKDGIGCE
jgi:micrococcal nuclease